MNEIDKIFTKNFEDQIVKDGWAIWVPGYCTYKTRTQKSAALGYVLYPVKDGMRLEMLYDSCEKAEEKTRKMI